MIDTQELQKKVRQVIWATKRKVDAQMLGAYKSAFRGQGMTFSDFREYIPGDDVRNISWSVTARAGKPFIKKYDEERELCLVLAIDISGSLEFGSTQPKLERVVKMAALLAYSASRNRDKIGLLLFSDQVELYIPPKSGRSHVERIVREIIFFQPRSRGTKIAVATEHLLSVLKRKSYVFLFSDFQSAEDLSSPMKRLAKKHDVVAVSCWDLLERALGLAGLDSFFNLIDFQDLETGEVQTWDVKHPQFEKHFKRLVLGQQELQLDGLKKLKVEVLDVVEGDEVDVLIGFLRRRAQR